MTQGEYEQVMGSNPSRFSAKGKEAGRVAGKDTSRHPVEMVSWEDAGQFCEKLSAMPKERAARRLYRLPTEAEWEYGCRVGSTTKWFFGDEEAGLGDHAWFSGNAGWMTHAVGEKRPNAWGLYDMYGNVWEWCMDWYGGDFYRQSRPVDPVGPPGGSYRVYRGGSWYYTARYCRSAGRYCEPGFRYYFLGLRVVCEVSLPSQAVSSPQPPAPRPSSAPTATGSSRLALQPLPSPRSTRRKPRSTKPPGRSTSASLWKRSTPSA